MKRNPSLPECVIFKSAPVALRCTRISLERASRVKGTKAPDLAILVLLSSNKFISHDDYDAFETHHA